MKVAVLFSGGKDSTFALLKVKEEGHEIKYLATVHCSNPQSFMYHTPNIGLTVMQSQALQIALVSKESTGEKEHELHDLKVLLQGLDIEGVVSGAIASKYQKQRIEKICEELGLKSITPLWKFDPKKLLKEMIDIGFEIIITAVAAEGFDETWLGRRIDKKCLSDLKLLNKKYGIHVSGEGGEYETLVLDCPLFKRKLKITQSEKIWSAESHSGSLLIKDVKIVEK